MAMKRIIGLILFAIVCGSGISIDAQNYNSILKARKPKTDANGYYSLLDCPRSIPKVNVAVDNLYLRRNAQDIGVLFAQFEGPKVHVC